MGLIINYTYDASVTNLDQPGNAAYNPTLYSEYTTAVQTAVAFFENEFTNPITININFGWGEVAGQKIDPGASGESSTSFDSISYSDLYNAFKANYSSSTASTVQKDALASLTSTDPTGGATFSIATAEEKALGIIGPSTANDGSVGLDATGTTWTWVGQSYTANSEDAVGTLEHEISEVMGRSDGGGKGGDYRPLDLFRYTAADGKDTDPIGAAAGHRDEPFVAGYNSNAPSYFSYDGKTVTLLYETPADVAGGADVADWSPSVGQDSFADGGDGAPTPVSITDLQEMNTLGYDLPCFLPNTRIATPSGDVPVQNLAVGDMVLTHRGETRPITWVGYGQALATRGRRNAATPVIVRRGALGNNRPVRDLRITKGHGLYLDDVLIPAEFLVNHRSILWDDRAMEVKVYHIELDAHDVLIANGAPAESYRDDGNRWLFRNANTGWLQQPKSPCAPVLTGGPIVDAIWRRLLSLSGPRPGIPTSGEPDLHLLVDGYRVDSQQVPGGVHCFRLPPHPAELRIASRAGAQDELGLARDPRQLGVAVRRIVLWRASHPTVVEANDPRLSQGFHAYEADNGFRWTDGDAVLPASLLGSDVTHLDVYVAATTRYPLFEDTTSAAA